MMNVNQIPTAIDVWGQDKHDGVQQNSGIATEVPNVLSIVDELPNDSCSDDDLPNEHDTTNSALGLNKWR